jgi:hypothetical protein
MTDRKDAPRLSVKDVEDSELGLQIAEHQTSVEA